MKFTMMGNTFVDDILRVDSIEYGKTNTITQRTQRLGGVENVYAALNRLDEDIETRIIDNEGYSHSESTILIDSSGERTSFVDWGTDRFRENFPIVESDVVHFAYIDTLYNLSPEYLKELSENGCLISADLCLSEHSMEEVQRIRQLCKHIDFLFCSETVDENFSCKGYVIGHAKDYTEIFKNDNCSKIILNTPPKKVVSTLGAGDTYAAGFLYKYLQTKDIESSVQFAHQTANEFISHET